MSGKKPYSPPTLSSEMLTVGVFGKNYNGNNGNHNGWDKNKHGILHWLIFK